MSSPNSPTLRLDVRTRRLEPRIARCVLGAALIASCSYTGGNAAVVAGSLACVVLVAIGLWRAGWLGGRHSLASVCWLSDGRWQLNYERDTTVEAVLCSDTRIGRRAAWLSWRLSGPRAMRRSLLIASSDLPHGELRRLLVRLRIEGVRRGAHEACA